jgi:hypothetical protein
MDDKDVKERWEKEIIGHAGVRLIGMLTFPSSSLYTIMILLSEPENFRGYDPKKKVFNQEVELTHDLEAIEVGQAEAEKFKYEHGDRCDIWAVSEEQWFVKFKKGARIFVPKAFKVEVEFSDQPAGILADTAFLRISLFKLLGLQEYPSTIKFVLHKHNFFLTRSLSLVPLPTLVLLPFLIVFVPSLS